MPTDIQRSLLSHLTLPDGSAPHGERYRSREFGEVSLSVHRDLTSQPNLLE